MKKYLRVLLTDVILFALSGCNTGRYDNIPQIMLVLETKYYEDYDGLTKQNITVLASDGNYYYTGIDPTESEPIDFSEDGLYNRLLYQMNFTNYPGREPLSKKELRNIRRNVQNFEKWSEQTPVECGNIYDYDRCHKLYGVYYDGNGAPQITWLAEGGSTIKCRNYPQIAKFVNSTGLLPFEITLRGD